jgi:uncharacterized protein YbjT (DUF2867 family)
MAPLRPLSRLPTALLVGWTLAMLPSEAAASDGPRTSSLSWERLPGAESCIATQDLARAVERRLRREVFVSAARADISVEGRVERTSASSGWRALVETRSPTGALLGTQPGLGEQGSRGECSGVLVCLRPMPTTCARKCL